MFMPFTVGGNRLALNATITTGTPGGSVYGFQTGSYGSIDDDTFVDGGGTTRTVTACAEDQSGLPSPVPLALYIDGLSVPNTNATFSYIVINGNKLLRSAATYNGSDSGDSSWTWTTSGFLDTSGTDPLQIWVG